MFVAVVPSARLKVFASSELRANRANHSSDEVRLIVAFDAKNVLNFDEGVDRLMKAAKAAGVNADAIVTSRDSSAKAACEKLLTMNIPSGFKKWQLPVYFDGPSQFFMSFSSPDVEVPEHARDEGAAIRVILSGSLLWNGHELSAGDWMYVPKGTPYSFKVGKAGVGMFYCYQCTCASRSEA